MKKIIFSLSVILALCGIEAKAQWAVIDPSNLAQNVLTVGKTGTTATNVINSFQEMQKIYSQGKEYYDALKSVHNMIKDARKVKETVEMVSEISSISRPVSIKCCPTPISRWANWKPYRKDTRCY